MGLCLGLVANCVYSLSESPNHRVLATGVRDLFPVPGRELFWGRELFHCAWCAEMVTHHILAYNSTSIANRH